MFFITQENELASELKLHALYFYASWMPYHSKMLIMIDKMEEKHKDIAFFAVDVDAFKGLCRRFDVNSVPTVIITNNGYEIKRITGIVMTSAFNSAFADIYNSSNTINGENNE